MTLELVATLSPPCRHLVATLSPDHFATLSPAPGCRTAVELGSCHSLARLSHWDNRPAGPVVPRTLTTTRTTKERARVRCGSEGGTLRRPRTVRKRERARTTRSFFSTSPSRAGGGAR